jgi:thioester reductase-like protein
MNLIIDLEKKGINITPEIVYKYPDPQSLNSYLEKENTNYMTLDDLNNELNTIYKKVSFKNISSYEKNGISKNILITGATGFLGSRLLTYILEKFPDYKIYCLVRSPKKLEKFIDVSKITILEGDISKEKFSLNEDLWDFLSSEIDEIFHLAADINHFKTYEQLKETNVLSINNIIEFLSVGKSKKLNYASTLAVFVDSFPVPTICKENDFAKNISFIKGGYAQSKWLAEQLLLKIENHVNINIFRFGLLVNDDSIGSEQSFDWLNSFILGFPEKIPFLKSNKLSFDFTPVSFAIKSMIEISESCVTDDLKIHHITSTRKVTLFELIKALKYCNNKVSRVNKKEWIDYMLSKNLDQNEKISFISLKNIDSHLSIFKTTNTNFDIKSINKLNLELPSITQKDINLFVKRIINASVQN